MINKENLVHPIMNNKEHPVIHHTDFQTDIYIAYQGRAQLRNLGWGGLSNWLQYYIGVIWQMITVYYESWVNALQIEEYHFQGLDKNILFFQSVKSHF